MPMLKLQHFLLSYFHPFSHFIFILQEHYLQEKFEISVDVTNNSKVDPVDLGHSEEDPIDLDHDTTSMVDTPVLLEPKDVSSLLRASHVSVLHGNKSAWLTNASVVRLQIYPLRQVIGEKFTKLISHSNMKTDAKTSYFRIVHHKEKYSLCDILEIQIFVRNKMNVSKTSGGDYFFVHIRSQDLLASAGPEGGIDDHKNGTYTAKFKLRWTGKMSISVKLVHSSEAISLLRRIRDNIPARIAFDGIFKQAENKTTAREPCHITPYMFVKAWESGSGPGVVEFCNFTDPLTGAPWYCVKPQNFPCSSYSNHVESYSRNQEVLTLVPETDRALFKP